MDPSCQASGGSNVAVEGENCLKEIANNYVEEEDADNSSGDEIGVVRENGVTSSGHVGDGTGGRHVLVGNGTEGCRDNADYSDSEGGRIEVSTDRSGEENSGESSEKDEENGDEEYVEEEEEEEEGEEEEEEEGDTEEGEEEMRELNGEMSGRGRRGMEVAENGYAKEDNGERYSGDATDGVEDAGGMVNGVEGSEKSVTESEGGGETGGSKGGRSLRRRGGRALKASIRGGPITPKLEEPRAVRVNRGVKRRFPGDESEDNLPKRVRVRSIASVCGDFALSVKGEDLSMEESLEATPAKKRGRPRRGDGGQSGVKSDEAEVFTPPGSGKRKMVEAVQDPDSLKRPCHGKNGTIFACNAEGCKKRFAEPAALYAHARVHGDRPYVCHYDGCIKSFSERSKLKRHFLIHTGEKPFLCLYEGCGKAFSLDFNLRSHMKTHTGEYNECPYEGCDKRYCQEYKLRAHIAKEHTKTAKSTKKLAKVVRNDVRGSNGSKARDAAAARRRERLSAVMSKVSELESMREGRVSRMNELEEEKQREANEVARIEKDLKRLERVQRQLEEGRAESPGVSASEEEEDADDEGDEEVEGEMEEEEEEEEDGEEGEEACPSNGGGGETSSSGEQQSRLEYTAMGEGKDVIMFAHKLPTADQGARLVKTMEGRGLESQQQGEATTSLTPLLWLQGPPPHHGHLAQHSALRPFLRSRRPGMAEVGKGTRALRPCAAVEEKERTAGGSSDSGVGKANGVGRSGGGSVEGAVKGVRGPALKKSPSPGVRGVGKASAKSWAMEKDGENGKADVRAQKREKESQGKAGKAGGGRAPSSEPVFVNPILLSSDHRFSPTDARFLSSHDFPSMAQVMLRDRLSKEVVKSGAGPAAVPREKVYRSMNEVLHSSTNEQGYSGCSGLNEGFVGEQGPSEQSFEPSAAQLFTYHEQSRLVD
ncbi:hypothetical protein M758_1G207500 [Ceratodon purpureus]|nr:hypothetical protein M758_1G207500 [Ceratodon purpureus]